MNESLAAPHSTHACMHRPVRASEASVKVRRGIPALRRALQQWGLQQVSRRAISKADRHAGCGDPPWRRHPNGAGTTVWQASRRTAEPGVNPLGCLLVRTETPTHFRPQYTPSHLLLAYHPCPAYIAFIPPCPCPAEGGAGPPAKGGRACG